MPYSQLLKSLMEKKKYSNKYVSKQCEKLGEPIAESYISKLLKGEDNIVPTEKKNEVLAKVLDVDVNLLNLEATLDKCPEEIINFLNMARSSIFYVLTNIYNNSFTEDDFTKFANALNEMPLAEFLIEINKIQDTSKISKDGDKLINKCDGEFPDIITLQLPTLIAIDVNDDSMTPLIPKGSHITLQLANDYESGEILYLQRKSDGKFLVRTCIFSKGNYLKGGNVMLQALNYLNFPSEQLKTSDIVILGKVKSVVNDLIK